MHSPEISNLIQLIGKLPGLGQRSGRRIALHLLNNKEVILKNVLNALTQAYETIQTCSVCGNLDTITPCTICMSPKRDTNVLCIVESVADLWAIERSKTYSGYYHVLGGLLSAIDGVSPDRLHLHNLHQRIEQGIDEVILSLSATVDGQTTLHFVANQLKNFPNIKITTLSHGVPVGGELDYLDDGTLTVAFAGRRTVAA